MKNFKERVLVTGGTGMVGSAIKEAGLEAVYLSSEICNLTSEKETRQLFRYTKPTKIIHLAAKVGGVKANTDYIGDFYEQNIEINTNVLKFAKEYKCQKVVSLLSTCVYPDEKYITYPLTEDQIHNGPPHNSNFGYAYAKRMLEVQSRSYNKQFNTNFVCTIPNNIFGKRDEFGLENSHVIPAIIRKVFEAKINKLNQVELWGSGTPLREFTYSADIANILIWILNNSNINQDVINVGNCKVQYSIGEIAEKIKYFLDWDGEFFWNISKPEGQFKKPSSNLKLLELGWKQEDYSDFDLSIKETCEWFKATYPKIRGFSI